MFKLDDIVVLLRRAANEIEAQRVGKRNCLYCGAQLPPSKGAKARKYCGQACRTRAYAIVGAK